VARNKKAQDPDRRDFLSTAAMTAGLVGTYGTMTLVLGRFLYPARASDRSWQFVIEADRVAIHDSIVYRTPEGNAIRVTRRRQNGDAGDFVALSSTCPHLGCRVHWEMSSSRFICPCHNGAFDSRGRGNAGPPGDSGMSLPSYDLKLEDGLLFIQLSSAPLTIAAGERPPRGPHSSEPSSAGDRRR